ncbi:thiamine pyrophosphate-binding protein [Ruminococcus sp.]|uniref:thiamine pyrophosphate-binding protein n=1 Tax=Ruminococcus sp. TaxID=41978 RepID=UPI0025D3012C|nr:thiamine pyrophosphate-binding protein [Ruminococcus sp.]
MDLIQSLKQYQAKYVVYPTEIEDMSLIQSLKAQAFECFSSIDSRSTIYMATGIAAQNGKLVVCIVNSSNASRSVFSGMTEAYYRKLPIVLITIGTELDYSTELGDVTCSHYVVSETDDLTEILNNEFPIHIELQKNSFELCKTECADLQQTLSKILDEEAYLLTGSDIERIEAEYKCKTINSGMTNCREGALANVLGASLAKIRKRYIGLVSEKEFIHDINTLGNINTNDRLLFIVVMDRFNKVIEDYACSLGFETQIVKRGNENNEVLKEAVNSTKKSVVLYIREK